jgi:3-(methylthio)propanoyl-CoA dehydrogenase
MRATTTELAQSGDADLGAIGVRLAAGILAYERVVDYVVAKSRADARAVHAGAVPHLKLAGIVHGGWQLARAALAAGRRLDEGDQDTEFLRAKLATARYFADHMLTQADGLQESVVDGHVGVLALAVDQF